MNGSKSIPHFVTRSLTLLLTLVLAVVLTATSVWAVNNYLSERFDANPVLADTDTDGAWYIDRYRPAAFEKATLAGENVLKISINASDGAQARPGSYSGAFYNTQGRKFNQTGLGVTRLQGDLYIPASWATSIRRSDIWATAFDAANAISFYPIIGFRNVTGSSPNLSYWDGVGWVELGPPAQYDAWYTFAMELDGTDLVYKINGTEVGRLNSGGSTYIGNVIMQAYNFNDNTLGASYDPASTYDAYWDNILTSTVINVTQGTYHARIQAAVDAANPGDVLSASAGTYVENVTINKALTLKGAQFGVAVSGRTAAGAAETTLKGTITIAASNVEVNGLSITNPGQNRAFEVANATPSHSNIKIAYNIIDTVGGAAVTSGVKTILVYRGADNVSILNNRISNIQGSTQSTDAISILDSVSTDPSTGLLIQGNVISNITSGPTTPKGAYGIIINNKAGAPGARILGNIFSNFNGDWAHAIGMEGPTPDAVVLDNTFDTLTATGADKSAIFFEKNSGGGSVAVLFNKFNGNNFYGVAIHPGDLPGGSNGLNYVVDARQNWWGNASGPGNTGTAAVDPVTGATANGSGAYVGVNIRFDEWLRPNPATVTYNILAPSAVLNGPSGSSATNNGPGSFLVALSQFAGNPSNAANFPNAGAFFDVFTHGATAADSLTVVLPANGTGFLYFNNGSTWLPVLVGGNKVSPSGGFYTFTLNDTTQPKLTDLNGTPFSSGAEQIRITPSSTTVAAGQTFQVVVDASSTALFGVDVNMTFDAAELEVTNIALGNGLNPGTIAVNTYNNTAGTLQFAYSQLGTSENNVSGANLTLATITFLAHTAGSTSVTLGNALFSDKDGNPATPAPLDSPITFTVAPSPSVYVDVALQGRSDHAGLQLEMKPTGAGNVLYDTSVSAGRLQIANVPAGSYQARVTAPKYLAAIQTLSVPANLSQYDLNAVGGTPASGLILALRGGDINGDDQINIQDLVLIGVNFGSTTVLTADINGDAVVNIQDLAIAAGNFGLKTGINSYPGYPNNLWD